MGRRRRIASEALMLEAARSVGVEQKVRSGDFGEATTEEIGLMVKAMIERGKAALLAGGPESAGFDSEP